MARIHKRIYQKDRHDPDNHDGVATHLQPDILECEVKWALESITMNKASRGDRIPAKPFQMLKHDAVKVLHSMCPEIRKTQQWPQDWKTSIFIPIPRKDKKLFILQHNHFTCQQGSAQNSPSKASTVRELRTSRCSS